jgi:glutaredoxin 2
MKTISVVNALNIDIELKDINDNSAYREELMQGGGKRQVPCLRTITSNGESSWLYESADIIKFFQKISA